MKCDLSALLLLGAYWNVRLMPLGYLCRKIAVECRSHESKDAPIGLADHSMREVLK